MAKDLIKYTKLAAARTYRPFRPLVKPLRRPIVLTLLLLTIFLLALGARFYPAGYDYDLQEQAARQPWKVWANYTKIRAEIDAWEKLLTVRPYSKDILLKLALLYARVNETEKARDYFNQAQYLDPAISPLPFSQP